MSSSNLEMLFAEAFESLSRVVHGLGRLPVEVRAEALAAHVAHVYAAGLRLPATVNLEVEAPPSGEFPADWPGLGRADRASPSATDLLRGLWSDLDRGARLPPESRASWWRGTFGARWGALAVALLERLQAEIMEVRGRSPLPVLPPPPPAVLPSFTPSPPQRRATGRERARQSGPPPRSVLGIRFHPVADGLLVDAVHPAGPAAGHLAAGELLTHVDGASTANRDDRSIAAILEGAPGQGRRLRIQGAQGRREILVFGVSPNDLLAAPTELRLLILDRDAAYSILATLPTLGFSLEETEDQEGLVLVRGPAGAAGVLRATLAEGAEHGLWDLLESD